LAVSYAVIVDRLVIPKDALPYPYKQFLLEATSSIAGKVVIDSGSNGLHSFDTQILSEYFRAPVIVLSDVAENLLRYKIYNLANYLTRGDILILPLEWSHYRSNNEISQRFAENVILNEHAYAYYINNLPLLDRWEFVLQKLPIYVVVKFFTDQFTVDRSEDDLVRLLRFENVLRSSDNTSFGGQIRDGPERNIFLDSSCDDLLFGKWKADSIRKIHKAFLGDLDLLEKLVKQGVTVYFAWPTVVDSQKSVCYESPEIREGLQQFSESIVESVESQGFQFIGVPEDSHFESNCFLDSPYHIRYSCAISRTHSFVESLRKHGVEPLNSLISEDQAVEVIHAHIESNRQQILEEKAKELPVSKEGVIAPSDHKKKILFHSGWSGSQEKGTWSIGTESIFQIRLDSSLLQQEYVYLGIDGDYFNGAEMTQVEIGDVSYSARILEEQFFRIPIEDISDQMLVVRLRHSDVRSPMMLGKGGDDRMIKFRLQTVSLWHSEPY
jgi:hypothetical protein